MKISNYRTRLIDKTLENYLKVFGAVSIEGPKWCGKTSTGLYHANEVVYMDEQNSRLLAIDNPKNILKDNYPELIDEWQEFLVFGILLDTNVILIY